MSAQTCWGGDGRAVEYRDNLTQRGYCRICACNEITSSQDVNLQFLSDLVPLVVGERVECWTMGEFYDGFGTIVSVSTDLADGGTPVHPAYLVLLEEPKQDDALWYTPICLKRARSEVHG